MSRDELGIIIFLTVFWSIAPYYAYKGRKLFKRIKDGQDSE